MKTIHITSDLVDQVLFALEEKTPFQKDWISWEIQDEFESLFISISIDALPATEPSSVFKSAGLLVNGLVPSRPDDYSWMLAFTREGKVVDSYFGGNSNSPNSGL